MVTWTTIIICNVLLTFYIFASLFSNINVHIVLIQDNFNRDMKTKNVSVKGFLHKYSTEIIDYYIIMRVVSELYENIMQDIGLFCFCTGKITAS
jgi:predicted aldo/keto reductase-like oxidoreductase